MITNFVITTENDNMSDWK